jgi:integrase/recombinase XerD
MSISPRRRHTANCKFTSVMHWQCCCPIWVRGILGGRAVRQAIHTTCWETAKEAVDRWNTQGYIDELIPQPVALPPVAPAPLTVGQAIQAFFDDMAAQMLASESMDKYRPVLRRLEAFCHKKGYRSLTELTPLDAGKFRATWKGASTTNVKNLERLKTFLKFCVEMELIRSNPAKGLKPPQVDDAPTLPYTPDEMQRILQACDAYVGRSPADARRAKALALLMRWSGMRLGDAARFTDDPAPMKVGRKTIVPAHIVDGCRLFLRTEKTGTSVYVPLPPVVIEALLQVERLSKRFYFWSGQGKMKSRVGGYCRMFEKIFKAAGIEGGHSHRFRDTFAVELLQQGTDLGDLSKLLGHKSQRVTEKHYSPWVKVRQERLERAVRSTWPDENVVVPFPSKKAASE